MTTDDKTYRIPSHRMPELCAKLDRLNRRAAKIDAAPVALDVTEISEPVRDEQDRPTGRTRLAPPAALGPRVPGAGRAPRVGDVRVPAATGVGGRDQAGGGGDVTVLRNSVTGSLRKLWVLQCEFRRIGLASDVH